MKQMWSKEEIEKLIANAPLYSHIVEVNSGEAGVGRAYVFFEFVNHSKELLIKDISKTGKIMTKLGTLYNAGFFKFKTGNFYDDKDTSYTIFSILSEGIGTNDFDLIMCIGNDVDETLKYQVFGGGNDLEIASYTIKNEEGETIYFVES